MRSGREWAALLLGVALLSGCDSVEPVVTDPLDAEALERHLEFLADDSLYGRGAASIYERRAAEYVRDEFASYGLDPGAGDYFQEFSFGGGQSQNVVGVLPGAGSLGSQWVIVGAHYDHLGWNQVTPDSIEIFNGADDNASGTAMLLELARLLSHYFTDGEGAGRDRRSIMFHAYGAEEEGLVGSIYFCNNPTLTFDNIAAMVDLDMVGRLRGDVLIVNGAAAVPAWEPVLRAANSGSLELAFRDDRLYGSDHVCFHQSGRPAIMLFTGLHGEYHTAADDVWLINMAGMLRIGGLAAGVVQQVATDPDWTP
jgi:hypothetical protein